MEPEVGNVLKVLRDHDNLVVLRRTGETDLVPGKDWTASVECELVAAAPEVQVVPVQTTARPGGDSEPQQGEDRGAPGQHGAEVEEEGGHPVLVSQHSQRLLRVEGVEVVNVWLVVSSDTVGNDLQGLRLLRTETNSRAWGHQV